MRLSFSKIVFAITISKHLRLIFCLKSQNHKRNNITHKTIFSTHNLTWLWRASSITLWRNKMHAAKRTSAFPQNWSKLLREQQTIRLNYFKNAVENSEWVELIWSEEKEEIYLFNEWSKRHNGLAKHGHTTLCAI